jgi:hypothetical protein
MLYLAENGAYVVQGVREISSQTMDPELVDRLVLSLRELAGGGADIGTVVCGKRAAYLERTDRPFRQQVDQYYLSQQVVDLLDRPDDGILKVTVYDFVSAEEVTAPALAGSAPSPRWSSRASTGSTSWACPPARAPASATSSAPSRSRRPRPEGQTSQRDNRV